MSYAPLHHVRYGSVYGRRPSDPLYRGLGQAFGANTWVAPVLGIGAGLFALAVISDVARDMRSNRRRRHRRSRRR